jgi:hypothetical protein
MRPRLLDLFCGAGGAAVGYHRAGFEVVGIDIEPQPNYPFEFWRGDALKVVEIMVDGGGLQSAIYDRDWAAIHASPPCQAFSGSQVIRGREHPDLITPLRPLLEETGLSWVIENVCVERCLTSEFLAGDTSSGTGFSRRALNRPICPFNASILMACVQSVSMDTLEAKQPGTPAGTTVG